MVERLPTCSHMGVRTSACICTCVCLCVCVSVSVCVFVCIVPRQVIRVCGSCKDESARQRARKREREPERAVAISVGEQIRVVVPAQASSRNRPKFYFNMRTTIPWEDKARLHVHDIIQHDAVPDITDYLRVAIEPNVRSVPIGRSKLERSDEENKCWYCSAAVKTHLVNILCRDDCRQCFSLIRFKLCWWYPHPIREQRKHKHRGLQFFQSAQHCCRHSMASTLS